MRNPFKRPSTPPPALADLLADAMAHRLASARAAGVWAPDENGEILAWRRQPGAHWATWRQARAWGLGYDDPRIGYRDVPGPVTKTVNQASDHELMVMAAEVRRDIAALPTLDERIEPC